MTGLKQNKVPENGLSFPSPTLYWCSDTNVLVNIFKRLFVGSIPLDQICS